MERRWNKADIHIHTNHSDGMAGVRSILQHVAETDLRVIAITDHDTLVGAYEAREVMAERRYPFELVLGEEVSTSEGHVLALFIDQPITPGLSIAATIAAIHACGGLAIAAHPYGKFVNSVGRKLERYAHGPEPHWRFDGVEAFNASLWNADDNREATTAATVLGLPACGGSDAHSLATLGLGYTLFPGRTAADLRAAIVAGLVQPGGTRWGWSQMRTVAGEFIKRDFYRVLGRSAS